MKINIIGKHPVIQPSFCGVLSLFESIYFSKFGHEVTLYLAFKDSKQLNKLLRSIRLETLSQLSRFGGNFSIEPIFLEDPPDFPSSDLFIWQSTSYEEWKSFHKSVIQSTKLFSQNFPKTVPFYPITLSNGILNQLAQFDLTTFALKEDYLAIQGHFDFWKKNGHKFCYVPRGADPNFLHANCKSSFPTIAIDTPNVTDDIGIKHFFNPISRLQKEIPELKIISLGRKIGLPGAEEFKFHPFDQLYSKFLNPAWIYCVVDYSQSPPHIQGSIHDLDRSWDSKAIYEVQTVEAQMAGCIIAGYRRNIIPELVQDETSLLFQNKVSEEEIYQSLKNSIDRFKDISKKTRNWAVHNFSWETCIKDWESASLNLIENGYNRNNMTVQNNFECFKSTSVQIKSKDPKINSGFSENENQILFDCIDKSRLFVEFKIGPITQLALRTRVNKIWTLETRPSFLHSSNKYLKKFEADLPKRHSVYSMDNCRFKENGWPEEVTTEVAAEYTKCIWSQLNLEEIDFVYINGRFRTAIALEASLRSGFHTLIAIENYSERPSYHKLENSLDQVASLSNFSIFRKGENWDRKKAFQLLDECRMDAR